MPGRITNLSRRALFLAADLPSSDPRQIAHWLYRYGTAPRGAAVESNFGPGDDPMVVLGLTSAGRSRHILEQGFEATTYPGWLNFTMAGTTEAVSNCKLYVSPRIEVLAEAFPIVAKVFTKMEVRSFKVGRRLDGLLRPDKIVAYFDGRPHLDAVAADLERELAGCLAQGVPFTTGIDVDGLLSWGTDPPLGNEVYSWRSWVTKVLAAELLKVKAAARGDVVSDLLCNVARLGINPTSWRVDRLAFSTVQLS